ncbi:MAG TPA: FlgD immunoglobulin-like domain containing protein [Capsulimonadaceae bacterium]|jgi:DNA-binding beta-propeller fold protein YncE
MNLKNPIITLVAAVTLLIATFQPAAAGGLYNVPLKSIPPAAGNIHVDGSLDEWPDVSAVITPLDLGVERSDSAAAKALRLSPHDATIHACYDAAALYVAVEQRGAPLAASAPLTPVALAVLTDRMAHIGIAMSPSGKAVVQLAIGDARAAVAPTADAVVKRAKDGKTVVTELRLPWALLSASGKLPADRRIRVAIDCVWPDLTPAAVSELPNTLLHHTTFTSLSFLTAPDQLNPAGGYLPNPSQWGTLAFTNAPLPNSVTSTVTQTKASVLNTPKLDPKPIIDGDLKEWPAGRFERAVYMPAYFGDRYSGDIATGWDSDNLYIAARIRTGHAISNPQAEATKQGYWGGDCLQIRLANGSRVVNLCAWYDSASNKPALTADGKDLTNDFLLKLGASEGFKIAPDRKSYTQEISIPWSALMAKAPVAGDTWKATFQIWWAGLNAEYSAMLDAALENKGALAYSYTMPFEGNVTVGVYDAEGHLLRWLTRAAHRRAGKVTEYWDGLDQFGQAIPAGAYVVKAVAAPPLGVVHKLTVGNPGKPAWPTADDTGDWIGDESTPQGCATDGSWVYLASPCCEKGWGVIGVDQTGQRRWGYKSDLCPRSVTLAVHGNYLYVLYSGPEITDTGRWYKGNNAQGRAVLVCLDKRTGKLASFSVAKPQTRLATWPYREDVHFLWDLRSNMSYSPATYAGQPRYFSADIGETENAVGMTTVGDRIYVSMYYDDKIMVLDAATAAKVDEIPVKKPVGLCGLASGKILAVSGGAVVSVDPMTKAVTPFITSGVVAPASVTGDSRGNVYVADWGKSFQVKVFDATGKPIRAIGKAGGRGWVGAWDPTGMLVPHGIAVTDAGKLWVAEDDNSPCRVSVWDTTNGSLVRDYIGPTAYGGGGNFWMDPKDPTMAVGMNTVYKVDLATGTATPRAVAMRRMSLDQPFVPNAGGGIPGGRTIEHDGAQYLIVPGGFFGTVVLKRVGDTMTPVAALGALPAELTVDGTGVDVWDSDIGHHVYANCMPPFFKGHQGQTYFWCDLNGDGRVQAEEMQWSAEIPAIAGKTGNWQNFWGTGADPSGSIYFATSVRDTFRVYRVDVANWTTAGVPRYDFAAAKEIIVKEKSNTPNGLYVTSDNRLVITYALEWKPLPKHTFECYDRDGKFQWGTASFDRGGGALADDPCATNMVGDFSIPGVGTVVGGWNWHMNFKPYLLTSDGLYLGSLLDDTLLGPAATWDESYKYYYQSPDGTPYIINGANDAWHVLAITGLDKAKRFGGTMTLTASDVAAAAESRTHVTAVPVVAAKATPRVAWAATPPKVDGDVSDWNMASGVEIQGKSNRRAKIALSRDADTLYLAYSVEGAKLVNKGSNWQTLFITGDCVDLMVSTNTSAKTHYTPAAGDERLLLSVYNGKPVAVLYQPVSADATSPVMLANARIERIVQLSSAKIATHAGASSYVIEAAIPLSDLGIDASQDAAAKGWRGDVGVIFADETGTNRAQRVYYYNKNTTVTADMTTEATLQPGEWGPMEVALGANLLKNPSFEEPMANSWDQGWFAYTVRNGAVASVSDGDAWSGTKKLLLAQTVPVTADKASYGLADYGKFLNALNGGKGGGGLEILQKVPVTAGKQYRFRFHVRTKDFALERKDAGEPRGYISTGVAINWIGATDGAQSWTGAFDTKEDLASWRTVVDERLGFIGVTRPYVAPAGATSANVVIRMAVNFADRLGEAVYDDFELVEAR